MHATELLLSRHSSPQLQAPAPSGAVLQDILNAALRVPDHAHLTPWRFIICQEQGLTRLGGLFKQTALEENYSEKDLDRALSLPQRAPMVIVCAMQHKAHNKVPRVEQIASTACAIHAMQMMAVAHSFSGIWRTGAYAHSEKFKSLLGLRDVDEVVGFLYLGTPTVGVSPKPSRNPNDYFEFWR